MASTRKIILQIIGVFLCIGFGFSVAAYGFFFFREETPPAPIVEQDIVVQYERSKELGVHVTIAVDPSEVNTNTNQSIQKSGDTDNAQASTPQTQPVTPPQQDVDPPALVNTNTVKQITIELRAVPIGADASRYTVTVDEGVTVYDVMVQAKEQGFEFSEKSFPGIGKYISAVSGIKEDKRAGYYWVYYVNGHYASRGVSTQKVSDGDEIEWKLEKK